MPAAAIPDLDIRVNGARLPAAARTDLRAVTVEEDLEALSMFTLTLYNWDDDRLQVSWSDSSLFAIGGEVEIWLGYVDDLHKVMVAEITNLEPSFTADEPPMLTVRGYDHRHRLARSHRTRTFSNMKDSAIASQVAREAGLRAEVKRTEVVLAYVFQHNQTDLEFLQQRAGLIGYELYVRDKVLCFGPSRSGDQPAATLTLGRDVTEFSPRLSSLLQVGEVTVRGWDVKRKQPIVASTRTDAAMGGRPSGSVTARRAFGMATVASLDLSVRSRAEADPASRGAFDAMAMTYVRAEVVARGQPGLRAGTVVDVDGAGRTFSGPYYVTSATHTVTPETGYQTTLTVQRNTA